VTPKEQEELNSQRKQLWGKVRKQRIKDRKGVNSFMKSMNDTFRKRNRYAEPSQPPAPPSAEPEPTE
jgi:hypothetical protein